MVDRDIFREEAVDDGAQQKSARAFERPAFEDDGYLKSARGARAGGLTQPPDGRAHGQAAHASDLGVGRGVGKIGEEDERLAQRLGAVVRPRR